MPTIAPGMAVALVVAVSGCLAPRTAGAASFYVRGPLTNVGPADSGAWGTRAGDFLGQLGPVDRSASASDWTWSAEAGFVPFPFLDVGLAARRYAVSVSNVLQASPTIRESQHTTVLPVLLVAKLTTAELLGRVRLAAGAGYGAYFTTIERAGYLEDGTTHEVEYGVRIQAGVECAIAWGIGLGFAVGRDLVSLPNTHSLMPVDGNHVGDVWAFTPELVWRFDVPIGEGG